MNLSSLEYAFIRFYMVNSGYFGTSMRFTAANLNNFFSFRNTFRRKSLVRWVIGGRYLYTAWSMSGKLLTFILKIAVEVRLATEAPLKESGVNLYQLSLFFS